MVRKRQTATTRATSNTGKMSTTTTTSRPSQQDSVRTHDVAKGDGEGEGEEEEEEEEEEEVEREGEEARRGIKPPQWIFFAIASGGCAAFNGVFAKLTTTGLTTSIASTVANLFGLSSIENIVEVVVRGIFFALNLTFNGIMWTLFTQALARNKSTTQVSIINTSANFVLTALLGGLIFGEALPPLWWAGAFMLLAGSFIVGRKKEDAKDAPGVEGGYVPVSQQEDDDGLETGIIEDQDDEEDEDIIDLGELPEERTQ